MYKMLMSSVVVVALVSLTGCGESADTLAQRQIDHLNELADVMEAGADKAKIRAIQERMEETTTAMKELDLSDEEEERLTKEYGPKLAEAMARVAKAGMSEMQEQMKGVMESMPKKMPALP